MADEPRIKYAPSILAADFGRLGEQVAEATEAGADYIHIDVMDGQFVPNLTAGPVIVSALRPWTSLPLDVHLMIQEPDRLIPRFAEAGAGIITVHPEACLHLHRVIYQIKDLGVRAGVSLNPGTPISVLDDVLSDLDLVMVMTVNPGFGGQKYIETMTDKIARMRQRLDELGSEAELEVDGGISATTAPGVVKAGARVLVAGSAVFNSRESVAQALARIKASVASLQT
jgi:ribulose-phosphate 3-epimerase